VAAIVVLKPAHQRIAGGGLELRIERSPQIVAPAVDLLRAELLDRPAARLLHEEVGVAVLGAAGRVLGDQRPGARLGIAGLGQEIALPHLPQHPVAALQGPLRMALRVVVVGALRQGGEIGGLVRRQLVQRLAEIVEGGRRHPVRAVAEEDLVQIQFEDLLFRQGRLEAVGEDRLLHLAIDAGLAGQQDVLRHLLGDGRAALEPPPRRGVEDVLEHRPPQAGNVDAAVIEEVAVLGREERLDHRQRNLLVGHIDAPLVRELADQGAVPGVDAGGGGGPVVGQVGGVRQVVEQPGGVDRHDQAGEGDAPQKGDAGQNEPAFRDSGLDILQTEHESRLARVGGLRQSRRRGACAALQLLSRGGHDGGIHIALRRHPAQVVVRRLVP